MTTLNARLTRRAFLGGAAAFGAAAMVSPKNAFADPTSADVQAQADEARQKLNSMREQLGAASANYNQAVQEHDEAVSKMDECQTKIDDNNAQIDKLQDKLSKRARNMYRDGQTTFLDVILGSNSFDDFAKNWDTLTSLNEKDSEMVEQTKNLRADNEAQKQEYANQADIAPRAIMAARITLHPTVADRAIMPLATAADRTTTLPTTAAGRIRAAIPLRVAVRTITAVRSWPLRKANSACPTCGAARHGVRALTAPA